MKKYIILVIMCVLGNLMGVYAQFEDTNTSVRFDAAEDDFKTPEGYELPAIKTPSLTRDKNSLEPKVTTELGVEEEEKLDITKQDGFLDNKSNKAPKYFTKDKEIKDEYNSDQFLGDVKTKGDFVNVLFRDHQFVDGDRIRVYVNGDIVQSNIILSGSFRGFDLALESGFNRIEFEALNQGSSGPNTAELHVYDDNGMIISAKEWNLTTGRRATIVVVKE